MKMGRWLSLAFLLAVPMLVLTSCGYGGSSLEGELVAKNGSQWLVAAYNQQGYIDAVWFHVDPDNGTSLKWNNGRKVEPDKVAVGSRVKAWTAGTIRESYPGGASADKVTVLADKELPPQGMIGRTKAVTAALLAQPQFYMSRAVKSTVLDAEQGFWTIELVEYEAVDSPAEVKVDARTGEVIAPEG